MLDQPYSEKNPPLDRERPGAGFYTHHIILCDNVRNSRNRSCGGDRSAEVVEFARRKVKRLRCRSHSRLGLTISGCLGRCGEGPCLVVYPRGIWCRFDSREDIEGILEAFARDEPVPSRFIIDDAAPGKP